MLTADKFKRVGYTKEEAERIDRPTISYWQDAWRRLKKNPVAMASLVVLGLILIFTTSKPFWIGIAIGSMIIGTLGHIEETVSMQHNQKYRAEVLQLKSNNH